MNSRRKFSPAVKHVLAERAGYICSRRECRRRTIGPHSDQNKSLSVGVAAHIAGKARYGPRYDSNQTETARSDIGNAIWLCHSCSDLVDKDEAQFTTAVLLEWKVRHEQWVSGDVGLPTLPASAPVRGLPLHNTIFVGRDEVLGSLDKHFATSKSTPCVLAGMFGVGKTRLAVEYVKRRANQWQGIWWIRAEDQRALADEYAGLARDLSLEGAD